jgi:hypothetical protein
MIVTFYSYKGGVGRSMALANVARWFALQGLRVVMIDWDLEAPGLESFFFSDAPARSSVQGRLGIIDLLVTYKDIFRSLPKPSARGSAPGPAARDQDDAPVSRFANVLTGALPPLSHLLVPIRLSPPAAVDGSGLWLLPAGSRSEDRFTSYAEIVQAFDWAEFYADYEGEAYFEWLRQQLLDSTLADIVLIDSRTGVAEMSGVCTRQLADVVVNLCAPNDQNLEGVAMMARSFTRDDVVEARGGRPIELVMVGSRIDLTEGRPIDVFEARFHEMLDAYLPKAFRAANTDFSALRIPYVSAYAYSERLAVGDRDGVKVLQDAYEKLAAHLALLTPAGSAVRQRCAPVFQRLFDLPYVYVTALDRSSEAHAIELTHRLEAAGVFVRQFPLPAPDNPLPAELIGDDTAAVVLVAAATSLQRLQIRDIWRRLRGHGIPTCIVSPGVQAGSTSMRPGLARARMFDAARDFNRLVTELGNRTRQPRVPFLAPPVSGELLGRDQDLNEARSALIGGTARAIALVGIGGVGKTAVARALCNDDEVIDSFEDGILWATATSESDLRSALVKWVAAFEGDVTVAPDLDEAERRLVVHLTNKRCLLAIDDVADANHLERIRPGPRCVLLITTRLPRVAVAARAQAITLQALSLDAAEQILTAELPGDIAPGVTSRLADLLGRLPLAMLVANRELRSRIQPGNDATAAMSWLIEGLEEEGLDAFGEGSSALLGAFTQTLEQLPPADRASLPLLTLLPAGRPVPIQSLKAVGVADAVRLAERLSAASLVEFDAGAGAIVVHPLTVAFARTLENSRRRAEEARRATAVPAKFAVYVSYRRSDSSHAAGRLSDHLTREFGRHSVFIDTSSIEVGRDWRETIRHTVLQANVIVVIIGRRWLEQDDRGGARLFKHDDFVRQEIAVALANNRRVIPVLVDGAEMPSEHQLPEDLRPLTRRNAVELSQARFNQDVDRLIESIRRVANSAPDLGHDTLALPEASFPRPLQEEAGVPASVPLPPVSWRFGPRRRVLPLAIAAGLLLTALAGGGAYWLNQSVGLRDNGPPVPIGSRPPATAGDAERTFSEAESFYFGRGVPRDYVAAAKYYERAADLGYPPALNALGRLYENGEGVARDAKRAIALYELAATRGHPDAQAALKRLRSPQ